MQASMRSLLVSLGGIMVLVTVTEIALSQGSMRKHVRFFAALLLMRALLVPIIGWMQNALREPESLQVETELRMDQARVELGVYAPSPEGYAQGVLDVYARTLEARAVDWAQAQEISASVRVTLSETGEVTAVVLKGRTARDTAALRARKQQAAEAFGIAQSRIFVE